MARLSKFVPTAALVACIGLGCVAAECIRAQAQTIPSSTAIPVVFTQTLEAGRAKPGDAVTARTTQEVLLPGGGVIPAGTALIGHVVESAPYVFDPALYAAQNESVLSVHFDRIAVSDYPVSVHLAARAIAGPVIAYEAGIPHYRDETDSTGTRILIGGDSFSPLESHVLSPGGDIAGYIRKQGVFARLLASDEVNGSPANPCGATTSEQSVGIFSPSACGVYGMDTVLMLRNGGHGSGTFALESNRQTVKLYAGSAALLQVVNL